MAELISTSLFGDANLVAYYRLEDVNDSKGSFNLTNVNSVTFTSAKYGNGANLGASNSNKYLTVANDLGITGGAITISLWVKLLAETSADDYFLAVQQDDSVDVDNGISYNHGGGSQTVTFRRNKANVQVQTATWSSGALGTANWTHLVYTYDATNIRGYANGVLVAGPTAASGNGDGTNADMFRIGANRVAGEFSSALIDDVAVFTRALTAAEVSTLYTEGGGNPMFFSGGVTVG